MDMAYSTAAISWIDKMYIKITRETSETKSSLDEYDINYFLSLFEGLSLRDYVDGLLEKDRGIKQEEAAKAKQNKKLLGG